MILIRCHTCLDLVRGESWPSQMPAVPRIGDKIQSTLEHRNGFHLELEVVDVTWKYNGTLGWVPEIELHQTNFHKRLNCKNGEPRTGSLRAFYEWYAPLVGGHVADFI